MTKQPPPTRTSSNGDQPEIHLARVRQAETRRRQTATILFAVILVVIVSTTSAQGAEPRMREPTLQYDATTVIPQPHPGAAIDPTRVSGGALPPASAQRSRPTYLDLSAKMANFDADAEPDGWRASLVLRDRQDRPVPLRARATFELVPHLGKSDRGHWDDSSRTTVRWSVPLEYDSSGIATVRLPLRKSLQPMLGWTESSFSSSSHRSRDASWTRQTIGRPDRTRTFVTNDLRETIGTPDHGYLRARVAVPTAGVFESVVPVQIRPSVLVDTHRAYR